MAKQWWLTALVLTTTDRSGGLTNGSGTSFRNTRLQLVAGDLNRVREVLGCVMEASKSAMRDQAAPMAQESFGQAFYYRAAN
jgi:hypothetical protein